MKVPYQKSNIILSAAKNLKNTNCSHEILRCTQNDKIVVYLYFDTLIPFLSFPNPFEIIRIVFVSYN